MLLEPVVLSPEFCRAATERNANFALAIDEWERDINARPDMRFRDYALRDVARARAHLTEDPRRETRLARCRCVRCEYESRLAGAAVSSRPCALCAAMVGSGSTSVDVLCLPCAQEHELCAHCAGDIQGRRERTDYPAAAVAD